MQVTLAPKADAGFIGLSVTLAVACQPLPMGPGDSRFREAQA